MRPHPENLIVGVDVAKGPDETVLFIHRPDRNVKELFVMRDTKQQTQKLSIDAASAILNQMSQLDLLIGKQVAVRESAMADIVEATAKIDKAWERRKALSDELDKFAPDNFMQPDGAAMPDTLSAPSPFPPAPPQSYVQPMNAAPYGYGPKPWHKQAPTLKRVFSPPGFPAKSNDDPEFY